VGHVDNAKVAERHYIYPKWLMYANFPCLNRLTLGPWDMRQLQSFWN